MNEYLTLGAVLILSIIGHNMTVVYATLIVIAIKFFGTAEMLNYVEDKGLNIGIIILAVAILMPIANGSITISSMINSLKTPTGIAGIISGLLCAITGGFGVSLMQENPNVIPAPIIGTMMGVFFFKGIAIGPLIAAGFTYFIIAVFEYFK